MRNLDLDSLQVLKAVIDYGSVTKAAAHLNRVQSNVTTRIKNLEDRLGVMLFQRQGGKLTPSAEGRVLLSYAERLLRLSAEAETALRSGVPQGTFRFGTLESTAAARLPPLLASFNERYPNVQLELVTGTSTSLVGQVHRFEIEAALVSEPFQAMDLETLPIFKEELVLIASHRARHIKNARTLHGCPIVAFAAGCSYRRILDDWLADIDVMPSRVLELASYHAIVACVAGGAGVGIMPVSVLRAMRAEDQIKALPLPSSYAQTRTHLVWKSGHSSKALEALKSELLTHAEPPERAVTTGAGRRGKRAAAA